MKNLLRSLLLAASAGFFVAATTPAQAVIITGPEFEIIEGAGVFTVINNSSDLYIWGFAVGNSNPVSASTTQTDWSATVADFASTTPNEFLYENKNLGSFAFASEDIGPNSRADDFFFNTTVSGSPFTISTVDANGDSGTIPGFTVDTTPIPASLPLFAGGLGLIALISRRRKHRHSSALAVA